MMRTFLTGALATLSLFIPASALARPIAPAALNDLIDKADQIVLARVELRPTFSKDEVATLHVLETWKGQPRAVIRVPFAPGTVCPKAPSYVAGKTVLAFLSRRKDGWTTTALSYGTLYPSPAGVAVFRKLVRQWRSLPSGRQRAAAQRAWLVECASHRDTRWHGLYKLPRKTDAGQSNDNTRAREPDEKRLTTLELKRIANGFVSEPPVDETLPMTLKLLEGVTDARVDRAAIAAVDTSLEAKEVPDWAVDAANAAVKRIDPTYARFGWWRIQEEGRQSFDAWWAEAKDTSPHPR